MIMMSPPNTLFQNVVLQAMGHSLPATRVTSENIESTLANLYDRLKLPYGRLELMTGIKERRVWPKGTKSSKVAFEAATDLFRNHPEISLDEIDLIIHASVCRDFLEPATASVVHGLLGLSENCQFFDLSNACLGVLNGMMMASSLIEKGEIRKALIVSGENSGPLLEDTLSFLKNNKTITRKEIKKYFSNFTIGSGAFAAVLSTKKLSPNRPRIIGGSFLANTKANHLCCGNGNDQNLMMETDSEELLKVGITLAKKNWSQFLTQMSWDNNLLDHVITHQVGSGHQFQLYKNLEIPTEKDYSTFHELGNCGSAALPLTLYKAQDNQKFKPGDRIALLGIGSGLSSLMVGLEWR